MADTLSCQWETLHSQQLRSIKKSIESDHGIYRYAPRVYHAIGRRSRRDRSGKLARGGATASSLIS